MGIEPVMVLLVGEGARNSLQRLQWLSHRGCSCQVAQSCRDACNLVSRTQFDLVLCQYQLPDRTAFRLVDGLADPPPICFSPHVSRVDHYGYRCSNEARDVSVSEGCSRTR